MNRIKRHMINFLAHHLWPCNHIVETLSGPPDRRPPLHKRIKARLHMMNCPWCTNYERQIRFIDLAVRREAEEAAETTAPAQRLPDDIRERIKRSLQSSSD